MTEEALFAWKKVLSRFAPYMELRRGVLGDGNGTVNVAGKIGWSWIRYNDDQHRLSMVRNVLVGQAAEDTPVIVGKQHPEDEWEQVLSVDWALYSWAPSQATIDQFTTPPHGPNHAGKGADPTPVDLNNLSPGKVVPTAPASLSVTVQPFIFATGTDVWEWAEDDIDLTADVPGVAGHCYVLVYMDLATNNLESTASAIVALGADPAIPACGADELPLAIIDLENGQTSITDADIYQYKVLYSAPGSTVTVTTLGDYARGYILRGGAAAWEAYDANNDGYILVGNGTDVNSVVVSGDVTLLNTGAMEVVAIWGYDVQDHAPLDGEVLVWSAGNNRWEPGHAPPIKPIYVRASQMWPSTTGGCAVLAQTELGVNDVDIQTLDFDATSDEFAQFSYWMPDEWNAGTLTYQVVWTAAVGTLTNTVEWNLQGRAYADSDALDQAWGASVEVSDALITLNDLHETAESGALTLGGTPAAGQWCMFRIWRDGTNDTLNDGDAKLLGVRIFWTRG